MHERNDPSTIAVKVKTERSIDMQEESGEAKNDGNSKSKGKGKGNAEVGNHVRDGSPVLILWTIYATHGRWKFHSLQKAVRTKTKLNNRNKDGNNIIVITMTILMVSSLGRHLYLQKKDGVVVKSMQARNAK
jgi:hypothetical protein